MYIKSTKSCTNLRHRLTQPLEKTENKTASIGRGGKTIRVFLSKFVLKCGASIRNGKKYGNATRGRH